MRFLIFTLLCITSYSVQSQIALFSFYPQYNQLEKNLEDMLEIGQQAVNRGANILIFGEGALYGHAKLDSTRSRVQRVWCKSKGRVGMAICDPIARLALHANHSVLTQIWNFTKKNNIFFILNAIENSNGKFFNTTYVINKNGVIAKHRKVHLFWTDWGYAHAGKKATIIDLPELGKIGLLTCSDGHNPSLFQEYQKLAIEQFIALGFGMNISLYEKYAYAHHMQGLYVDSLQFAGSIGMKEMGPHFHTRNKRGYFLYNIKNKSFSRLFQD